MQEKELLRVLRQTLEHALNLGENPQSRADVWFALARFASTLEIIQGLGLAAQVYRQHDTLKVVLMKGSVPGLSVHFNGKKFWVTPASQDQQKSVC